MPNPTNPYILKGNVVNTAGVAQADVTVRFYSETNNEYSSTTTNDNGEWLFDCRSFTSGYTNGDKIMIIPYGTMYCRATHDSITKTASDDLRYTLKLKVGT